jgi:8-oxo-dGTP pyrophosphatase MutT (NUDIX family)
MHIHAPSNKNEKRLAAGVLMPLLFRKSPSESTHEQGSFVVLLIKRSLSVAQAGDLSFPGGMLNPIADRLLRCAFLYRLLPSALRQASGGSFSAKSRSLGLISLFMATALREAWEEIRLSPFRTRLLGSLPTYNLTAFKRTIFPVAGFVDDQGALRPNGEVEKLIEIPLSSFYDPDSLGSILIAKDDHSAPPAVFPCLFHTDSDGAQEILWGATFYITVEFLRITLDYRLPEERKGPVIARTLSSRYLSSGDRGR